ncbi:amino acid adenylation domain-containing protein [Krasilnikovia sp. MM14-A1004]|uniref:amino acid adenylation domain-containing protein n=1 Tax=Krasilnikovia sp. MM14-A1004 TaxID=3373541 RepID=UPI00399D4EBC
MRADSWEESTAPFTVVRSMHGHLSIWPADRPVPGGWTRVGRQARYAECLAAVEADPDGPRRPDPASCPQRTIPQLVADVVRRHGDRPAVRDADHTLTYRDLDRRSDAVAAGLRARGVEHGDRVAVHLPRGADVFVALLAILKAGAAYVPVDTRYPAARRTLMVGDSGARLVITTPTLRTEADDADVQYATVDELTTPGAAAGGPDVCGCHAACVLFTSGSSGTPKAIVLEHRNLVYFARNPALPALTPHDRVAHVSSLSFDAFTFEAWNTLTSGAEIVVLPTVTDLVAGDPRHELSRHGITAMLAPTMAVNHIAREDPEAFAGLRILHTGGDVILPAACRELLNSSFDGTFSNLYGPTEATTACTSHRITPDSAARASIPIGAPLAGAQVHLLDADRRPVPDGQPGELFIGGAGVARGYLGRPGLTASRFLPDPFTTGGGRIYATGDLARRDEDGQLEFLGRVDDQVKIRGYRVEPREVERTLARFPGVRDVAVVAAGEGDGKHLVALVTGDDVTLPGLRAHAEAVLPDYLVPAAFAVIARIPANGHGKRDTAQLLAMAQEELRHRRDAVAPRDEIEAYLARLWRELLGVETVSVLDDFFALGGNSLLAFRLRRRAAAELATTITMEEVLTESVLADLAGLIRARKDSLVG